MINHTYFSCDLRTITSLYSCAYVRMYTMYVRTRPTDLPPGREYVVNLPPELMQIVVETRNLEQLGYMVPEQARNVALQEEKLLGYQDGLKRILMRYRMCTEVLTEAEVSQRVHTRVHLYCTYVCTCTSAYYAL